jgi:hypothetical protein
MADVNLQDEAQSVAHAAEQNSGTLMRVWQHNATRMLRANERLMNGVMSTAKLQIELGQEVLQHRLDRMNAVTQTPAPEAGKSMIEQQTKELERLMHAMREMAEEMRTSFAEAAKLLFEDVEDDAAALRESADATARQAQDIVTSATRKALRKTESAAEKPAETAAVAAGEFHEAQSRLESRLTEGEGS